MNRYTLVPVDYDPFAAARRAVQEDDLELVKSHRRREHAE